MASNINPNFPAALHPLTQSVRDNFVAAKTEIEALQATLSGGGGSGGTVQPITVKNVNGAYTLVAADLTNNTMIRVDAALNATVDITIPHHSTAGCDCAIGTKILLSASDFGFLNIVGASGVTVASPQSLLINRRSARVLLIKTSQDFWEVDGQLNSSSGPTVDLQ